MLSGYNPMRYFYKMAIDLANDRYLSGWCFHRLHAEKPVELECRLDEEVIAKATADIFREDLRELGVHPTGRCGFELVLQPRAPYPSGSTLTIGLKGSSAILRQISTDTFTSDDHNGLLQGMRKLWPWPGNEKSIVFMHIPKTAGTSFNTFALSLFPKGRGISHIELIDKSRYPELQRRCRYISGHLPVGVLKKWFHLEQADLYTIIREPYAHLHSHLKWLIRTASTQNDNYFRLNNPAIIELGEALATVNFSHLKSLESFIAGMNDLEAAFLDNMQLRYFLDQIPRRTEHADLDKAKENCRLFRQIGITERYAEFTAAFIKSHAPIQSGRPFRLNRSREKPLFDLSDPAIRKALYPLVYLDLQLYEGLDKHRKKPA